MLRTSKKLPGKAGASTRRGAGHTQPQAFAFIASFTRGGLRSHAAVARCEDSNEEAPLRVLLAARHLPKRKHTDAASPLGSSFLLSFLSALRYKAVLQRLLDLQGPAKAV